MPTPLAQTFNETASAAHDAFPQELKKLVVLLTPASDTPVYVSPEIAAQLTKGAAEIKKAVEDVTKKMHDRNAVGLAGRNYDLSGTRVDYIALNQDNARGIFSERYTKEMRLILTLDHEIGHHILKNGHPSLSVSGQLAESAADTFAMLRHIQRFGKNTDHAGGYGEYIALAIVLLGDTVHYTTEAIQKAIQYADENDILKLSLQETAALADKISSACQIDDEVLERICDAFQPVNTACKTHIGGALDIIRKLYEGDKTAYDLFCRETLVVMRKLRHDPEVFKAGKRFLSYPLLKDFMTESAKTDSYWSEALAFMDSAEKTAPAKPGLGGILQRMKAVV